MKKVLISLLLVSFSFGSPIPDEDLMLHHLFNSEFQELLDDNKKLGKDLARYQKFKSRVKGRDIDDVTYMMADQFRIKSGDERIQKINSSNQLLRFAMLLSGLEGATIVSVKSSLSNDGLVVIVDFDDYIATYKATVNKNDKIVDSISSYSVDKLKVLDSDRVSEKEIKQNSQKEQQVPKVERK